MNPHQCAIALRPRGPFEVLDLTWRFLRERHRPFLVLAGWTAVPAALACALLAWVSGGAWWTLLLALAVAPALQAPFTLLAGRLLFAENVSVPGTLRQTVRVAGGLVLAWAALGFVHALVCTGVGLLGLPLAGYLTETAVLERVPLARGLSRSMRLAMGHLGGAILAVGGAWALTLWGALLGEVAGQSLLGFVLQLGEPAGSLVAGDCTPWLVAGLVLVQPVIAAWRLLLYVDARTRLEGWDLQVGLRALGLRHEEGA